MSLHQQSQDQLSAPLYQRVISTEGDAPIILQVLQADITQLQVDAIVNAANNSLLGGGGVDGAIHRAAGPELLSYCRALNGCATGAAKISPGFELPAHYVIHTVGPVWHGGEQGEAALLASCYQQSLQLAEVKQLQSIAFPAISTGVYGYPKAQAANIAIDSVCRYLGQNRQSKQSCAIEQVIFCCFSADDAQIYADSLAAID